MMHMNLSSNSLHSSTSAPNRVRSGMRRGSTSRKMSVRDLMWNPNKSAAASTVASPASPAPPSVLAGAFDIFLRTNPVLPCSTTPKPQSAVPPGADPQASSFRSFDSEPFCAPPTPQAFTEALESVDPKRCQAAAAELYKMLYYTVGQTCVCSAQSSSSPTHVLDNVALTSAFADPNAMSRARVAAIANVSAEVNLPDWVGGGPELKPSDGSEMGSVQSYADSLQHWAVPHQVASTTVNAFGNDVIAEFEIIAELGRGAFGVVNLAVDVEDQTYAIKTVFKSLRGPGGLTSASCSPSDSPINPALNASKKPGNLPRNARHRASIVERELAIMKKIRHKHLVQLHAVIEDPMTHETHLVMQYIENGPIGKMKDDGSCYHSLTTGEVVQCMLQVASGLEYLHRHDIIHRDIKPENILLGKDRNAYVADFGMSDIAGEDGMEGTHRPQPRRALVGTMAFIAPELIESADAVMQWGRQSDVWAFGVTLYTLLVKKLPFYGWNHPTLVRSVLRDPVTFPPDCGVPLDLQTLLKGLLVKDPAQRISLRFFRRHEAVQRFRTTSPMAELPQQRQTASSPLTSPLSQASPPPQPQSPKASTKKVSTISDGSVSASTPVLSGSQAPLFASATATFRSSRSGSVTVGSRSSQSTQHTASNENSVLIPVQETVVYSPTPPPASSASPQRPSHPLAPKESPSGSDFDDLQSEDDDEMEKSREKLLFEYRAFEEGTCPISRLSDEDDDGAEVLDPSCISMREKMDAISVCPVSFNRRYIPHSHGTTTVVSSYVTKFRDKLGTTRSSYSLESSSASIPTADGSSQPTNIRPTVLGVGGVPPLHTQKRNSGSTKPPLV